MRRFVQVLLVVAAVAVVGGPASAGTEHFPEMSDECSGYVHNVGGETRVRPRELDLCKGWFASSTTGSGAPVLQLTLETSAAPDGTVAGLYNVGWRSGNCSYGIIVDGAMDAPHPQAFSADCEQEPTVTCTVEDPQINCATDDDNVYVDLPDGSVAWHDNRLQVTVAFEGDLAPFAADHADGAVLSGPRAVSAIAVGPAHGWAFACSNQAVSDRCVEVNGDWMYPVRDYTVRL